VPDHMLDDATAKRAELVEAVANVDDEVAELFLGEEDVPGDVLYAGIRRSTIANAFFPVFMGSAYRNVGVQLLLDGVASYLPDPTEVRFLSVVSATASSRMFSLVPAPRSL
jgi:elongation factor G